MSLKNAAKYLSATNGAVKYAGPDAPMVTGIDHVFGSEWSDLGAIKTPPKITPNLATGADVPMWNMENWTGPGSETYTADFGTGQFDYESLKMFFNFLTVENGGFRPGSTQWNGQLAILINRGSKMTLIHAPNAVITGKGAIDFLKNDLAELAMTFALNGDSRIDGAPFTWFDSEPLVPELVVPAP